MNTLHSKKMKILAIVIAIIIISVAFFVYQKSNNNVRINSVKINNVKFGPEIIINNTNNNTLIRIEIFSINPEIFYEKNIANKEYLLFNSTINKTQNYYMSPLFFNIVGEWKHLFNNYKGTNEPSLIMEAFKTVESNNKTYVYNYYNNIPFNPYNILTEKILTNNNTLLKKYNINNNNYYNITFSKNIFKINLNFNNKPVNIINNNATQNKTKNNIDYINQPDTCYIKYFYTYPTSYNTYTENTGVNTIHGVLPLGIIHFSKNTENSKSLILITSSIMLINATVNLNSNQVSINRNGEVSTTMSSNPYYAHIANASIYSSIVPYGAYPLETNNNISISRQLNTTTAYEGIQNVVYTFTHYKTYTTIKKYKDYWEQKYKYVPGKGYYSYSPRIISSTLTSGKTVFDSNYTVGGISYINTINNIQMKFGFLPIAVTYVLQNLSILDKTSSENLTLNYTGNNIALAAASFYSHINGYLNTESALKNTGKALKIFSSGISLGLAVDVLSALNVSGDSSTPEIVADSLGLISSVIGSPANVLSLFNSIGSTTNTAAISTSITDAPLPNESGSNYSIQMYFTKNPINVDINGNDYSFYAPINYFNATKVID